jgi:hypothetical protein
MGRIWFFDVAEEIKMKDQFKMLWPKFFQELIGSFAFKGKTLFLFKKP